MIHVHIRDDEHRPTLDLGRLTRHRGRAAREHRPGRPALHRRLGARPARPAAQGARRRARLVQPDDGHHELRRRRLLQPVAVRHRALPALARSARWCRSSSCSTSARCTRCDRLLDRFGLPYGGRVHVDLVMGVPGGMPGTADALVAAVAALPAAGDVAGRPPASAARRWPVALASLSKGGHLRVGMEDVLTLAKGVPVEHNEQLVERAVAARRARPAHPDDAGRGARAAADQASLRHRPVVPIDCPHGSRLHLPHGAGRAAHRLRRTGRAVQAVQGRRR